MLTWLFRCICLPTAALAALAQQSAPPNYILGPDDQITLSVANLEEMSGKPTRIDMHGDINLPLAGHIHVAGLTAAQLEGEIESRLKTQLNAPRVIVGISEFRSQPVSILGEVGSAGVHQLEGRKTLVEMLSLAGGLRTDSGNSVTITRKKLWGAIPLPTAQDDASGEYSVATVSVKGIMNGSHPAENIVVQPEDVITVPKATMIYVIGSVKRPGGFVLAQEESLTALQLLSMAEGLDRTAAGAKAKVMRARLGSSSRTEIPIDLGKLLAGKIPDIKLNAEDILFVPNSAAKTAFTRSAEAAVTIGTGLAIYAHP